jgi:hypothetical protein
MRTYRAISPFIAIILLASGVAEGHATNIQASDEKLCAFKLEGLIAPGDHDRLADLIGHSRLNPYDERTNALCLKSSGGSYDEGIKISELIYSNGISTVVPDDAECFSTCAVIFMAGVIGNLEPERKHEQEQKQVAPHRKLSAGGILGFHAPYLSLSPGNYSKEQMESSAQDLRRAILALVQLSSRQTQLAGNDFVKKSLIVRIREKGPTEVFYVKTIGDAVRWNIDIYDAAEQFPKPPTIDGIKNLCNNFMDANLDEPVPQTRSFVVDVDLYASKYNKDGGRILVRDSWTKDIVCELYPHTKRGAAKIAFEACGYDYWSSNSFGDCREYKSGSLIGKAKFLPDFFILDPATVLKRFQ